MPQWRFVGVNSGRYRRLDQQGHAARRPRQYYVPAPTRIPAIDTRPAEHARLQRPVQRPLLGIAFKIASICLFVIMMVAIKFLHQQVPIGQIIFARSILGLAAVCLAFQLMGQFRGNFTINSLRSHVSWATSAALAMAMWFVGLTLIPLPEATAISFIMPLLVVALAWLLLGEKIRLIRWIAVAIGITGVGIIIWPSLGVGADYTSASALGAALSLGASFCWAFAQISLRRLSKTESSGSAVVSFSVATMILALFSLPFGWTNPTASEWGLIAVCGIAGGFGQLSVALSLRYTEASALAPFEYLLFPVSSVAAIIWFGEYPDSNIWIGLPFVVFGGLLVIFREHQLSKRKQKEATP